jgi:hypothetical protein
MFFKHRIISEELQLLTYLNRRMNLPEKDARNYWNLKKGFEGEKKFDEWLASLTDYENWLVLNDLLLKSNNTTFQIDSMLLSQEKIYFFEVKNYEGDYYIDAGKWKTIHEIERKNPLLQLERSESLLRQLLQELGYNFSIEAYVIFVNPQFHLYEAPRDLPIIFPTQLHRFINKLNSELSKNRQVKLNTKQLKLAEKLVSLHLYESPYTWISEYSYDQLKKGTTCYSCHSFSAEFTGKAIVCSKCGCKEDVTAAVLRSAEEYKLLFPDRKITTSAVHEWCKIIQSKKTIRRILSSNFKLMGHQRSAYYVNK